jgi:hypothetical protein
MCHRLLSHPGPVHVWSTFGPQSIGSKRFAAASSGASFPRSQVRSRGNGPPGRTLIRMGSCLAQPPMGDKQRGSTVQATPSAARRRPPAATSGRGTRSARRLVRGGQNLSARRVGLPQNLPGRHPLRDPRTSYLPATPGLVLSVHPQWWRMAVAAGASGGRVVGPRAL